MYQTAAHNPGAGAKIFSSKNEVSLKAVHGKGDRVCVCIGESNQQQDQGQHQLSRNLTANNIREWDDGAINTTLRNSRFDMVRSLKAWTARY
jgi:hypothetical protein